MKIIDNILQYGVYLLIGTASVVYLYGADIIPESTFGGTYNDKANITLIGSEANLVSLPLSGVNANATTTDASGVGQLADGGATLQQDIDTSQVRDVLLNIESIHGTATSTMFIVQEGSFNGTDFFRIASSTVDVVATSTIPYFAKAIDYDGALSTTSPGIVIPFSTYGYPKTRFIIWGEDASTDPNDGVQAWITASLIRDTAN